MEFIDILKYAFLGLLQGVTEPIPVSSSGHVIIAQRLFGLEIEGLSFEVLVNFASLLAVLFIYRTDLIKLARGGWGYVTTRDEAYKSDFRFIMYLVAATVPAGIIGVLFSDVIADALKGMTTIGVTLLATGVALWLIRNMRGQRRDKDLTLKDAVLVGLAQAVALIPGVSRSGATIVAAMGLGMKSDTALKFSFMLYIPVSIGSIVLEGGDLAREMAGGGVAVAYTVAFVCSLVASYFALRWFMGVMARGNLIYFSIYCLLAGTAVLVFL